MPDITQVLLKMLLVGGLRRKLHVVWRAMGLSVKGALLGDRSHLW